VVEVVLKPAQHQRLAVRVMDKDRFEFNKVSLPFSRTVRIAKVRVRSLKILVVAAMVKGVLKKARLLKLRFQWVLTPVIAFAYRAKVRGVLMVVQRETCTFRWSLSLMISLLGMVAI
jgi:hypothetical protein